MCPCTTIDLTDPSISPLLASTHRRLPQTYIHVSGADPLRDEGLADAEILRRADVPVEVSIFPSMPHAYQSDLLGIESRYKARAGIVAYCRSRQSLRRGGAATDHVG